MTVSLQLPAEIDAKYKIVRDIKKGRAYLGRGDDGRCYVLKPAADREIIDTYKRLKHAFEQNKSALPTLYLPDYIETIGAVDVFEFVEGATKPWTERSSDLAYGGALIGNDLVAKILDLSADLDKLGMHSDFYWRNFVFMPGGRIAVVDWERFTPAVRSSPRLAYLYCLMFNNVGWQLRLVAEARRRGLIEYELFRDDVVGWVRRFRLQWSGIESLQCAMAKIADEFSNVFTYNAVWNGVNLPTVRAKSGC